MNRMIRVHPDLFEKSAQAAIPDGRKTGYANSKNRHHRVQIPSLIVACQPPILRLDKEPI
jgi:hypothetical protein